MQLVLLVIQIILALGLIGVILLQRTSTDGLSGLGGGSGNNIFSNRTSTNLLTRTTAILMFFFIVNSLILGNISIRENAVTKLFDQPVKTAPDKKHHETAQPLKAPLVK